MFVQVTKMQYCYIMYSLRLSAQLFSSGMGANTSCAPSMVGQSSLSSCGVSFCSS